MMDDGKAFDLRVNDAAESFIRKSVANGDYVRIRYDYNLRTRSASKRKLRYPTLKRMVKTVSDVEQAVGFALESSLRDGE